MLHEGCPRYREKNILGCNRAPGFNLEVSDRDFSAQTEPLNGRGLYEKTEVRCFSVKTEEARLKKVYYKTCIYFSLKAK